MKKLFVLTGAGISKESGISTFRDSKDGLWNNFKIEDVASPKGWRANPQQVLDFYNARRRDAAIRVPNEGHKKLAELEKYFEVNIFTQNVDDLHEKAGSTKVWHVHGSLTQARSSKDEDYIVDIGYEDIKMGDVDQNGFQMRPNVVFFDEFIYYEQEAQDLCKQADCVLVVGTSLLVYPASGFINYRGKDVPLYIVDPGEYMRPIWDAKYIKEPATVGMPIVFDELIKLVKK